MNGEPRMNVYARIQRESGEPPFYKVTILRNPRSKFYRSFASYDELEQCLGSMEFDEVALQRSRSTFENGYESFDLGEQNIHVDALAQYQFARVD